MPCSAEALVCLLRTGPGQMLTPSSLLHCRVFSLALTAGGLLPLAIPAPRRPSRRPYQGRKRCRSFRGQGSCELRRSRQGTPPFACTTLYLIISQCFSVLHTFQNITADDLPLLATISAASRPPCARIAPASTSGLPSWPFLPRLKGASCPAHSPLQSLLNLSMISRASCLPLHSTAHGKA